MTAEVRALRPGAIPPAEASKPQPAPRKPGVDWDAIEQEYRAGQLNVRHIARIHGVSHSAINKRAKREQWERDLTGAVRQRAKVRLLEAAVSTQDAEVSSPNARGVSIPDARDPAKQEQLVDAAAARQVAVITEHRQDIARLKNIARKLGVALEIEIEGGPARATGEKETVLDALTKLSRATRDYVGLERQAWNVDANPEEIKPFVKLASRRGVPGHS